MIKIIQRSSIAHFEGAPKDNMENLFQKMGLYDIWTVLFPGTIFLVGGRALYDFMASLGQILSTTDPATSSIIP